VTKTQIAITLYTLGCSLQEIQLATGMAPSKIRQITDFPAGIYGNPRHRSKRDNTPSHP
jgi:hypothetical protein